MKEVRRLQSQCLADCLQDSYATPQSAGANYHRGYIDLGLIKTELVISGRYHRLQGMMVLVLTSKKCLYTPALDLSRAGDCMVFNSSGHDPTRRPPNRDGIKG